MYENKLKGEVGVIKEQLIYNNILKSRDHCTDIYGESSVCCCRVGRPDPVYRGPVPPRDSRGAPALPCRAQAPETRDLQVY